MINAPQSSLGQLNARNKQTNVPIKQTKGSQQCKKVTKLRTLSVPPLAPPASMDTYGGLFSKSAYRRLATFGEKARMLPFLEETYPFH